MWSPGVGRAQTETFDYGDEVDLIYLKTTTVNVTFLCRTPASTHVGPLIIDDHFVVDNHSNDIVTG